MEAQDRPASKDDIKELQRQITRLGELIGQLRKYAPTIAQKRARWYRLTYEAAGLVLAAIGAWLVYPPAAWLLVGSWMLAEVIVSSRRRKGG